MRNTADILSVGIIILQTAYTTQWILYLLANNDQEKKEIRIKGAPYVKFVIKESMRLYPVAPFLTRILPQDSIFGDYQLHKGVSLCFLSLSYWRF
jgi:ecdysteroid 2-hydroxylase